MPEKILTPEQQRDKRLERTAEFLIRVGGLTPSMDEKVEIKRRKQALLAMDPAAEESVRNLLSQLLREGVEEWLPTRRDSPLPQEETIAATARYYCLDGRNSQSLKRIGEKTTGRKKQSVGGEWIRQLADRGVSLTSLFIHRSDKAKAVWEQLPPHLRKPQ